MNATIRKLVRAVSIRANLPYQAQRAVVHPKRRAVIAKAVASRSPTADQQAPSESLRQNGYLTFPGFLSAAEVGSFRESLSRFQVTDRYRAHKGSFPDNLPHPETHVADYSTADLLSIPKALEIANRPDVLAHVSAYLGCKPTISNIMAWWSYPGHDTPEQAENFHRDVDDWKFIKLFVYLTDVDHDNGPHCYVPGSVHSPELTRIRRYTDAEVAGEFGDFLRMTGSAGDAFLEDTFGLHKGQLCRTQRRLLFQVQYSLRPIGIYDYEQLVRCPQGMDPYINRLYCS